ncbi:MAG: HAD family phosphatase [Verrucomicrobiae bacterium]|nr:HAD family phosphatase [Verrucomicrobiae bacterium]
MPSPRAVIFDMDELLIQSAPIWRAAEQALCRAMGKELTPEAEIQCKGMNAFDVARTLHALLGPAMSVEACQKIMRSAVIEAFSGLSGRLAPMPGAVSLVRRLHGRLPLAVASGSPLPAIEAALERIGIRSCMQAAISSESVVRGKPQPDVFLAAAARLGVAPQDCLVFEDSLAGAQAAKAAGMRCYAVPSADAAEIRRLADATFDSLEEVTEAHLFS